MKTLFCLLIPIVLVAICSDALARRQSSPGCTPKDKRQINGVPICGTTNKEIDPTQAKRTRTELECRTVRIGKTSTSKCKEVQVETEHDVFTTTETRCKNVTGKAAIAGRRNCDTIAVEHEDTLGLIRNTLSCTDCLKWKPTGLCNWMRISVLPPSVTFHTSLMVEHYLPDFVISSYSTKPPFPDITGAHERNNGAIETEKNDFHGDANQFDNNLDFKHVDVFVNPAIPVYNAVASAAGFSCKSSANVPFFPHFISDKDPSWEKPIIEQFYPQAISGFPRMSRAPAYWGPIYPRTGWTALPWDGQSALVTAQRAAEIVSGGLSTHVFVPPNKSCGDKCWLPGKVTLDNRENAFQQVFPPRHAESSNRPLPRDTEWVNGREYDHQSYGWVWWRQYECCQKNGDRYLGRIKF